MTGEPGGDGDGADPEDGAAGRRGSDDEVAEEDAPDWTNEHWLESRVARRLVWVDVALTIVLAIAVIGLFRDLVADLTSLWASWPDLLSGAGNEAAGGAGNVAVGNGASGQPFQVTAVSVFVFALLGAIGYVFTVLFRDVHRSAGKVVEINFRIVGAIPLAAGAFLLSQYILDGNGVGPLGLAFVSGLYVNLAYERFGAIADYLLPAGSDDGGDEDGGSENATEGDERDRSDGTADADAADDGR